MGEIADSMIGGEMCQICMEPFDEPLGYPAYCDACQDECGTDQHGNKVDMKSRQQGKTAARRRFLCPVKGCNRKLKTEIGVKQHLVTKHPDVPLNTDLEWVDPDPTGARWGNRSIFDFEDIDE